MRSALLLCLLIPVSALGRGLDADTCADTWERYFDGVNTVLAHQASQRVFARAVPKPPTAVAACEVRESESSTLYEWHGERRLDAYGADQPMASCVTVDVIEVGGKAGDRCERFEQARLCRNLENPTLITIDRGESQPVACPGS